MLTAIDQFEEYFACQFEPGDWLETRAIWPQREAGGPPQKHWHRVGEFKICDLGHLHERNHAGWNIYVGANPRKAEGLSGDDNVSLCRSLFVDFDHVETPDGMSPGSVISEWIDERRLPAPTMLINSGHGIHAYWRLVEPMAPEAWRLAQQRMIAWLKSDPAIHNPERIMRLPGTVNTKSEPHVPCFVVYCDLKARYDLATILGVVPELASSTAASSPQKARDTSILEARGRAILYAAKWGGVAEGERNQAAFAHACQMLNDFGLSESEAWPIVWEWNHSNTPPLAEPELRSVFASAKSHAKRPAGNKLDAPRRSDPVAPASSCRKTGAGAEAPPKPIIEAGASDCVSGLSRTVEDEISGRSANLELKPFPIWSEFGQCFVPDSRTVIVGGVGGSKSLLLLQMLTEFNRNNIQVSVLELEKRREFHMRRLLAQASGIADVTKPRWVKEHAGRMRELIEEYRQFLDTMGRIVHVPASRINVHQAIRWMQERAATDRVICIDPVTILAKSNTSWVDDERLINAADKIASTAGCSIVFVTHPAKGQGGRPDIDSLAGGAAWGRFADAVVWLGAHEPKMGKIRLWDGCGGLLGTTSCQYNRTLHLLKTRSAEGQGWRLACTFDARAGLVMYEQGLLCHKEKGKEDE